MLIGQVFLDHGIMHGRDLKNDVFYFTHRPIHTTRSRVRQKWCLNRVKIYCKMSIIVYLHNPLVQNPIRQAIPGLLLQHCSSKPQLLVLHVTATLVLPWPATPISISLHCYIRPTITTFATSSKHDTDQSGYGHACYDVNDASAGGRTKQCRCAVV